MKKLIFAFLIIFSLRATAADDPAAVKSDEDRKLATAEPNKDCGKETNGLDSRDKAQDDKLSALAKGAEERDSKDGEK